jgi:hypothetical protein
MLRCIIVPDLAFVWSDRISKSLVKHDETDRLHHHDVLKTRLPVPGCSHLVPRFVRRRKETASQRVTQYGPKTAEHFFNA